ncbi:MAG: hypothetical protein FWE88_01790 [Phycisphaerae bacterium]|nr:hypothetical protein [Phycisphaerae bacterium]
MTTEIAIMNKSGMALAADSAMTVTIHGPGGQDRKIHNTANKVFALSKHAPVAAMIYDNSQLMEIPWETIIKQFRNGLAKKRYPTLKQYGDEFLRFLSTLPISEEAESSYIRQGAYALSGDIRGNLDQFVALTIKITGRITEVEIKAKLSDLIMEQSRHFHELARDSSFSDEQKRQLCTKYESRIVEVARQIFENLPLAAADYAEFVQTVVDVALIGSRLHSGVVIAGFGEDELYPSYYDYEISGVIQGRVIARLQESQSVDDTNDSVIAPFAQSSDVRTFMEGMGRDISEFFDTTISEIARKGVPGKLVEALRKTQSIDDKLADNILHIAQEIGNGAYDEMTRKLKELKYNRYINPVLQATRFLQKNELAMMAETLVNLVSFRKQVTMEAETVGGPIDVVVITKGDGFVWIKRKSYFSAELNHHFFRNYFDHGDHDDQ